MGAARALRAEELALERESQPLPENPGEVLRRRSTNRQDNAHEASLDRDRDLLVDPDAEVILPKDDIHRLRDEIDIVLVIAVGGFLGTLCRYELSAYWVQPSSAFPMAIFAINVSGSVLIGLIITHVMENMRPTRFLRPLTCVGFLGGWTTMSTFAVGSDHLISAGHPILAVVYIAATLIVAPLAAAIGISLGHALHSPQERAQRASDR